MDGWRTPEIDDELRRIDRTGALPRRALVVLAFLAVAGLLHVARLAWLAAGDSADTTFSAEAGVHGSILAGLAAAYANLIRRRLLGWWIACLYFGTMTLLATLAMIGVILFVAAAKSESLLVFGLSLVVAAIFGALLAATLAFFGIPLWLLLRLRAGGWPAGAEDADPDPVAPRRRARGLPCPPGR